MDMRNAVLGWRVIKKSTVKKGGNYQYFLIENTSNNIIGLKKTNLSLTK